MKKASSPSSLPLPSSSPKTNNQFKLHDQFLKSKQFLDFSKEKLHVIGDKLKNEDLLEKDVKEDLEIYNRLRIFTKNPTIPHKIDCDTFIDFFHKHYQPILVEMLNFCGKNQKTYEVEHYSK